MKFRNQRHQALFHQAIRRLDRQNYTLMAVVYLFATDNRLWSMTEKSIQFDEKNPYTVPDNGGRTVEYAERKEIVDGIMKKYPPKRSGKEETRSTDTAPAGQEQSQRHEPKKVLPPSLLKRKAAVKPCVLCRPADAHL